MKTYTLSDTRVQFVYFSRVKGRNRIRTLTPRDGFRGVGTPGGRTGERCRELSDKMEMLDLSSKLWTGLRQSIGFQMAGLCIGIYLDMPLL